MADGLGIKIDILGSDTMAKKFNQSPKIVADKLDDALSVLATIVMGTAKENAPVKTSSLRSSIHKQGPNKSGKDISYEVGTDIFYAPFQEFGTRYIKAREFFKRGREEALSKAPKELKGALGDIVTELAR